MSGRGGASMMGLMVVSLAAGCLGAPPDLPPPPVSMGDGTTEPTTATGPVSSTSAADGVTSGGMVDSTTDERPGSTGVMGSESSGGVTGGDCCRGSDTPGCADPNVEECVCSAVPECCEVAWDQYCVEVVDLAGCGMCGLSVGECCEPHTPCSSAVVSDCVCALDSSCCDADWDLLCVATATTQCGLECANLDGTCCEPGMQIGCDDWGVVRCTCAMDRSCCSEYWSDNCALLAVDGCMPDCS